VWATTLSSGEVVAAIVNWRETTYKGFSFPFYDLYLYPGADQTISIYDMNTHEDLGHFDDKNLNGILHIDKIPGHGSKVFRFKVVDKVQEVFEQS